MICDPCKKQQHKDCPTLAAYHEDMVPSVDSKRPDLMVRMTRPPTGLSPDNEAIQRSGLCPCHHKVAK